MGKKDKKDGGGIVNREIFQRMNFLYQAATFMATLSVPPPAPVKGKGGKVNSSDKEKNLSNPHGMHGKDESAQPSSSSEPTNECTGGPSDMVVDKVAPADHVDQGLLTPSERPPQRLSRRKRKAIFQKYKLELAAQQISPDPSHHRLLTRQVKQRRMKRMVQGDQTHDLPNSRPCISHEKDQQQQQQQHSSDVQSSDDQYALSGAARFFASTMREIGRKNVVRIGPSIKQTVCQRCEAVLIPAISCEVRVGAEPQLHTQVTCLACGAFRRYYCMPKKNAQGDQAETKEEMATAGVTGTKISGLPDASTSTPSAADITDEKIGTMLEEGPVPSIGEIATAKATSEAKESSG